ncbi:MAG: ANTAR domain-containing protein [Thiogranum sp.]|nr:ANTAR domain-containing protein [Thiogranum sp.]
MPRRILLVRSDPQRAESLYRWLQTPAYLIDAEATVDSDFVAVAATCQPRLVIIDVDAPDDGLLARVRQLCASRPLPVVLFTRQDSRETIRKAVQAGVSSYIVDGFEPRRLVSLLDVAVARFHETERLKTELQVTRATLAERKTVERAKGILMKQKGLDEPQAYHALRKLAMDRNLRIGQAAENVIAVAEVLEA